MFARLAAAVCWPLVSGIISAVLSLNSGYAAESVVAGGELRPNILWITAEDLSPNLGCYGDRYATTPNLDKLAERGVRYTHAFATAPVCSPAQFLSDHRHVCHIARYRQFAVGVPDSEPRPRVPRLSPQASRLLLHE